LATMFTLSSASADYCSICVKDYCQTIYSTDNDGDGMKDDLEVDLAKQFKPSYCVDYFA